MLWVPQLVQGIGEGTMEISEYRLASVSRPTMQVTSMPVTTMQSIHEEPLADELSNVSFADPGVKFPQLNLRRDRATRVVVFDLAPMREQLRRNGLSMESVYELSQEGLRELLLAWYLECIGRGGQCSAEITAAVREIRAENPTYSVVIRPVWNAPEGFKASQALKPQHEVVAERPHRVGLFEALTTKFADFLCEDGDIEVEKPYTVPDGPALHLRPARFRRMEREA
jgi:hypothetical protein